MAKAPFAEDFQVVMDGYEALLNKFEAGEMLAEEAAHQMLSLLKESPLLPQSIYPWGNPPARHLDLAAHPELAQPLLFAEKDDATLAVLQKLLSVQKPQVAQVS